MNLYWGFGECIECHDRQGPWVLEESKWYCESCHKKLIKRLLKPIKNKNNSLHQRQGAEK